LRNLIKADILGNCEHCWYWFEKWIRKESCEAHVTKPGKTNTSCY